MVRDPLSSDVQSNAASGLKGSRRASRLMRACLQQVLAACRLSPLCVHLAKRIVESTKVDFSYCLALASTVYIVVDHM